MDCPVEPSRTARRCAIAATLVWALTSAVACLSRPVEGVAVVTDVRLEGADHVDEKRLLAGLVHHPPKGWFVREAVSFRPGAIEGDLQRIEAFCYRAGLFEAEVSEPGVERDGDRVTLTFPLDDGPQFEVSDVVIRSDAELPEKRRQYAIASYVDAGDRYDYEDFRTGTSRIRRRLQERGYYDASVESESRVDRADDSVEVRYTLDPGRRKAFGDVELDVGSVPAEAIRERIAWSKGETYSPDLVDTTKGRLFELDALSTASFRFESEPGERDLDVTIRGQPALENEVRLSAGVLADSSSTVLRAQASYVRRNFLHPLRSLRLNASPEWFVENQAPGFAGELDLVRDDALGIPRARSRYGVRYGLQQYEGFRNSVLGARASLARPLLDDRLTLAGALGANAYDVSVTDGALEDSPARARAGLGRGRYAYVDLDASLDRRDAPFKPTQGTYVSAGVELGNSVDGDALTYGLLRAQVQAYMILLTRRVVLGLRAEGATRVGSGPLPPPARIFGGGASGHRGFARRELSPGLVGEDGSYVAVGGEAQLLTSAELRLELFRLFGRWAGIVLFTDAGDVAYSMDALDVRPPHLASGLGLRLGTPVGSLRIDAAARLNRLGPSEPAPGERFTVHLAFGEAF